MSNLEIIDDFLSADVFNMLRKHCDTLSYAGVTNPVDGVLYPGISVDIPQAVRLYFGQPKFLFMRLSLAGVPVPHQAHTDTLMGELSMMFYLNRQEHCQGGTSLVRHKATGMVSDPQTPEEEVIWKRDTNKPAAWEIYEMAEMQPNRVVVFPAKLMHRAEPLGGFGNNAKNGRLVMTAFY